MLSYKFRIYPSKTTQQKLNEQLGLCRWLYNRLLEELNEARAERRKLARKDTQALIVKLKEENSELKQVYAKVLQMVNYQLWSNIKALARLKKRGRKVGRLRFKGRGWFKTLNYNRAGFKIKEGKLVLSKIGEIPIRVHRKIGGKVKGVIVKRENSGRWHAIFQVEDKPQPLPEIDRKIGMDVGIKHFLTDTEGRQIENPKFYRRTLGRIRIRHKELSRKRKGSRNREKARIKLAKAHEKLVDQRDDFLHKLSRFYVNNYDVIAVEDLNIAGMVKNRHIAQKILDASWRKFFRLTSHKAERAGRTFTEVNPRGTSQNIPEGFDRDYVASLRILRVGLGRPEQTPVEMGPLLSVPAQAVVAGQAPSLKQESPCESWG